MEICLLSLNKIASFGLRVARFSKACFDLSLALNSRNFPRITKVVTATDTSK